MRTYTRPGLADAAVELLGKLGMAEAIIFGWSLGDHIAIEVVHRMRGLMITGTPPVGGNNITQGFAGLPHAGLASRQNLSEAEIDTFLEAIFETSVEPFLRDPIARTDGRFRKRLFEAARRGRC